MNSSYCLDIRSQASRAVAAGDLDEVRRIADLMAPGPGRDLLLKRAGLVKPNRKRNTRPLTGCALPKPPNERDAALEAVVLDAGPAGIRRTEAAKKMGVCGDLADKCSARLRKTGTIYTNHGGLWVHASYGEIADHRPVRERREAELLALIQAAGPAGTTRAECAAAMGMYPGSLDGYSAALRSRREIVMRGNRWYPGAGPE